MPICWAMTFQRASEESRVSKSQVSCSLPIKVFSALGRRAFLAYLSSFLSGTSSGSAGSFRYWRVSSAAKRARSP